MLSCMSYLYTLEINLLSTALFANIFSHSVDCLFLLFMLSFAVQKLLSRSHLHQKVFFLFFSNSFIVSGPTFRSFIHFEFNFVYSVRECFNFILLHIVV